MFLLDKAFILRIDEGLGLCLNRHHESAQVIELALQPVFARWDILMLVQEALVSLILLGSCLSQTLLIPELLH